MTQQEVTQLAHDLMSKHGLIQQGWSFKFDNARRRVGVCKYHTKTIGLSKTYLPHMKKSAIKDTILHEIAHALVGDRHRHNHVWRRKAREIGCNGKKCLNPSKELYAGAIDKMAKQAKYTLKCPNCDEQSPMHRKPKRSHSCGTCGNGVYNPKYKLELIQNY